MFLDWTGFTSCELSLELFERFGTQESCAECPKLSLLKTTRTKAAEGQNPHLDSLP